MHPQLHAQTNIKAQTFDLLTPCILAQEIVVVFGGIAEARQILTEEDNHIWAFFLGFGDKLQLVKAPTAGLVVACHNDLFLLDSKR